MTDWLEEHGRGEATINYKLRDWLFSRQRYWGEPFPIFHQEDGSTTLVPESDLPVLLPDLDDFKPSGEFEPPLARASDWIETVDPETGKRVRRDANTMPQWAGSCWYYLRFCDPRNTDAAWSQEAEKLLDAGGPLRRRSRARGAAPAVLALLAQGAVRPGPGPHRRAVPEAPQPGHDPRLQLPLLRRQPERRPRRPCHRLPVRETRPLEESTVHARPARR